ncbi:MAG: hypothetical protein IKR42_00895 [Campylobacter sp.]|nr:hypothetical protein [Campylobacter sp.]
MVLKGVLEKQIEKKLDKQAVKKQTSIKRRGNKEGNSGVENYGNKTLMLFQPSL